jgi:hypothetical protein
VSEREPWIAVKVGVPDSSKIIDLPTDAARWGLIVLWSKAKRQTPSGVFRSERVARSLLGTYARHFRAYVARGFVHVAPVKCPDQRCEASYAGLDSGAIAVHSWHDHQRESALRQLAYRVGTSLSDPQVTPEVTTPMSTVYSQGVESAEGGPGETSPPDLISAYYNLTTRFPQGRVLAWLNDIETRHGPARSSTMLATCYSEDRDLGTLLGRTQSRLRAEDHAADRREKSDEIERNRAKRAPLNPLQAEIAAAARTRYGEEERYVPPEKVPA